MADPKGILPFDQFLAAVNEARHTEFAARPASKVAHEDSFAEMRTHILRLYDGVEVVNSFVDENGSVFDCVPVEQQPSLRGTSGAVPSAPDMPPMNAPASAAEERRDAQVPPQMAENKDDPFGNVMYCPPGTIPIRRVTLEDLTRFEDMRSFFRKAPGGGAIPPRLSRPQQPEPPQVAATHRWAHAFQSVNNVGGHSFLNLWQPAIGANQIFSLSQHWYAGGSGANLQTAEVGWQVYPQFYNNSPRPVFFIYWTADGYGSTGCYNLTCSAFVQTNNSWAIGGAIPTPYSSHQRPAIFARGRLLPVPGTLVAVCERHEREQRHRLLPGVALQQRRALPARREHRLRRRNCRDDELSTDGQRRVRKRRLAEGRLPASDLLLPGRGRVRLGQPDRIAILAELLHGTAQHLRVAVERIALVRRPGRQLLAGV